MCWHSLLKDEVIYSIYLQQGSKFSFIKCKPRLVGPSQHSVQAMVPVVSCALKLKDRSKEQRDGHSICSELANFIHLGREKITEKAFCRNARKMSALPEVPGSILNTAPFTLTCASSPRGSGVLFRNFRALLQVVHTCGVKTSIHMK